MDLGLKDATVIVAVCAAVNAQASGGWFEEAPPTLPFYLDRLPAKTIQELDAEQDGSSATPAIDFRKELTALTERADRGMSLGRGVVGVRCDFEVNVERERDRVERGAEVCRRRGDPHDPVVARAELGTSRHPGSLARNSREREVPSGGATSLCKARM